VGFSFLALNSETGKRVRFFFSLNDFRSGLERRGSDEFDLRYLDLGETITDWYEGAKSTAEVTYKHLIGSAKTIFTEIGIPAEGSRNIEILVGHICYYLSQRISRAESQLRLIDESFLSVSEICEYPFIESISLPQNTAEAMSTLMSDEFGSLVEYLMVRINFGLETRLRLELSTNNSGGEEKTLSKLDILKQSLYLAFQQTLAKMSRASSIAIVSTYLGGFGFVLLNALLGQVPAFVEIRKPKLSVGESFTRGIDLTGASSIQDVAHILLKALIPVALLERYSESTEEAKRIGLPVNPQVIFTANAFLYDDVFKAYVNNNIPNCDYVVAQHGNNYGIAKYSDSSPEYRTPDLFLSWGWIDGRGHVFPFGQIKPRIRAKLSASVQGVSLVVRDELSSFLYADVTGPNERYLESLMSLCDELEKLRVRTYVRLHASTKSAQRAFWENYVAKTIYVTIDLDNPPIDEVIRSGLGVVFTYDSTGMLELGSADVPFFFFASEGLGMVKDEFRSNYRALSEAGLLSSEPAIAAKMIYEWINASPNEQTKKRIAVKKFLSGISFYPRNKLFSLRKILIRSKKASKESRALTNEAE